MKKLLKWVGVAAAVLIAAAALWIGGLTYVSKYKIADIDASVSPDGRYVLAFQSVGEPDFPFGASHARIVLKDGKRKIAEYRFDVANDGALLFPENWAVTWWPDCVTAVVSGDEQDNAAYTFYFDGSVDAGAEE